MKKVRGKGAAGELRQRAEKRVRARRTEHPKTPAADARRLVHELEVHQLELEMQNEELRAARAETEAHLERYKLLFDFAPTGYAILSADGVVREVNHVAATLLGSPRSRIIGGNFNAFLTGPDRSTLGLRLGKTLERETTEVFEVQLTKPGEIPLTAQLTARALVRPEPRVLLALEDVTERKLRERAQAQVERTLREIDSRKDAFMAALGHELRNPLAPIRNSLYVLGREHGRARAEGARAVIDRQVRLLTRLVDDLLDVNRIAHGKIRLERTVLDVVPLVRRTVEDHRTTFEASGVRLEARLARGPFSVVVDGARFMQALGNLLGNAEKFTPRGGVVTVVVERVTRDEVAVRVRDTGVGIAPELLGQLFDSYVQAPETVERSRGGLGLGLSVVKGIVELHGGTVGAASAGPGRGTEVTIRLPLVEARDAGKSSASPLAPSGGARRVLVIDDNVDHADSLQWGLEVSGHVVQLAYDGAMGVEQARRHHPDVIVSDISLPGGMDGYAVARAIRADPSLRNIYLVAMSGYSRPEDVERSADAGFDRHLGKPTRLEELEELISRAPVTTFAEAPSSAPQQNRPH
jgi:two-component system CheB/CheR fusion protein